MRQEMMFVDGEWTKGSSEESIDVINPATEEKIATVPRGTREDAKRALDSARAAQKEWEALPPLKRAAS
ncbi:MAG: aldehyde dehydrogenase family protein, partial [Nitrososphaerota archaeon]|nr:aldehyde dehydrogenase family protein [Nitrososphaerota archaeon]